MPTATPVVSERAFQGAVLALARRTGWKAAHFNDSRRQIRPGVHVGDKDASGFPDLTLARAPRLIFAELKAQKGRVKPDQQAWIDELAGCFGVEAYIWRPSDWDEIVRVLGRRA